MSNSEKSAEHLQGTDPFDSGNDGQAELKAMLDTIASQMQDADRRHMAALNDMQHRISGMEREAEALRPRVPDQFAPAFEQIEVAIGQLAHRLADAGSDQRSARKTPVHAHGADSQDAGDTAPADAFDPWNREAIDALASHYETGEAAFPGGYARSPEGAAEASGLPHVDEAWLESKFAEIVRGIEYSLTHLKPDSGLSEFGERFDQFERQFGRLFAGVATHDDFTAFRQIEAHMDALVNHLEKTQDHLERLNMIEAQLADVSRTLAVMQATSSNAKSAPDIDAVARTVAEETARRVVAARLGEKNSAADELRPLIEQLMAESRQGGEQTVALLDTMQQAMVRLLDRAEAIDSARPAKSPAFEADRSPVSSDDALRDEDLGQDEAVDTFFDETDPGAYIPGLSQSQAPSEYSAFDTAAEDMASRSEKLRQELVADARRAKMRLAAEDEDMPALVSPSVLPRASQLRGAPLSGSRPIRPAASAAKNTSGPSAPSPRLMIVAALVLVALAGLWYTFGNRAEPIAVHDVSSGQASPTTNMETSGAPDAAKSAPAASVPPSSPSSSAPSDDHDGTGAPTPNVNGPRGDLAPGGDAGEQTSAADDEAPRPRTALPMLGVAVDLNQPTSEAELQQARRHQVMAAMSGELGNAASRPGAGASVPASMIPTEAETEVGAPAGQSAEAPDGSARSAPLDMPAATVGPLSLRLAAANGDPSAEFEVGARFAEGEGVKQNFIEAAKWYQRSADQGFAQSQYRIGTLYERGLGLKPDRAQAAIWYRRAADQGNIKAMHNLAVLSASQTDRSPDYATAAQWFEEAAKRGLPDSQFNLAVLYENGLGVTRDLKQAFMWLSIAARAGDADALRRRDILRGKLTAQEIAETQKMMTVWKLTPTDRTVNDAVAAGELWKKNPKNGING